MAYQVLARKWRPRTFAQLVGQEHVIRALANAFASERLHHAYLLTGTRGVGKTTIARIMAKALNCETGITSDPCGVCSACTQIDAGRFVDLLEIDAASNTGIDNIREVLDNAQYAPTAGRFKVYIIDEVHMLSKSAFNAMLKTLEEPPGHVKFILATTDPQKVPITVLSRCLQFSLRQMTPQQVSGHLNNVLNAEQIQFEPGALPLLGHAANGSMRDALSLLDQAIAYGAGQVEEAGVRAMLGAVDQSYLFELLNALIARDGAALMAAADAIAGRGLSYEAALHELAHLLHQIAVAQTVPGALADDLPQRTNILAVAQALAPEDTQLFYQIALHGRRDLPLAPDEYAGFTMTLLRMLAFAPAANSHIDALGAPAARAPATAPVPTAPTEAAAPAEPTVVEEAPQRAYVPTIPVQMHTPEEAAPLVAAPAPAPAEPTPPWLEEEPANRVFDGDWRTLLGRLKLGRASMLAQHAELTGHDGDSYTLRVADEHKMVATRDYQESLREALEGYFGRPIQLKVNVDASTADTPAAQAAREREQKQRDAEAQIQNDGFVQTLVRDFGASILPDSIKPV
ncbi:DNA polymerase-3 subunit gamma/tau [Andreprevotia lacus DSM 23236]|jgi:DNA polymerase-3 subunit gamma/tau|uniref:DNA polymerase III subunit gamma/tau n=1 Tax=Andreprevotia lacus DSM 23236 TaxID=1121001 RepID=A0A1W1XYI0_9NEIS|nr:DNA polymerase III subunit gamma/tau [Andreprevotia lacus]SMC29019.1 DNA polymerase-3 subunit gamma/tau [Andreprevotia lacus DSM 23236]